MMNELNRKIEEYLEREDIKPNLDTISLYDFYKIMEYKFEDLIKTISLLSLKLQININDEQCSDRKRLNLKNFYCTSIDAKPIINEEKSKLYIYFCKFTNQKFKRINIEKDDEDKIICDNKYGLKIIGAFYEDLEEIFNLLDKYHFVEKSESPYNCQIPNDYFNIKFFYDISGQIALKIIKEEISPNTVICYVNHSIYLSKLNPTKTVGYPYDVQKALLRKIPVNVSDLNDTIKPMIQEYLSMNNAPLLVKKR